MFDSAACCLFDSREFGSRAGCCQQDAAVLQDTPSRPSLCTPGDLRPCDSDVSSGAALEAEKCCVFALVCVDQCCGNRPFLQRFDQRSVEVVVIVQCVGTKAIVKGECQTVSELLVMDDCATTAGSSNKRAVLAADMLSAVRVMLEIAQ